MKCHWLQLCLMLYGLSLTQKHKNNNSWTIDYHIYPKYLDRQDIANMADPYQTAPKRPSASLFAISLQYFEEISK